MQAAPELVFVSIASYRDPQLVPTIQDCLLKAADPGRLRFGICWQHGAETLPQELWDDPRFRILDVDWHQSQGACWARAQVMKLWSGEHWFLQVDSHCRFRSGWDHILISALTQLDQPRAVLSTYATPFVPGAPEFLQEAPQQIAFQGFTPEGIPYMKPLAIRDEYGEARLRRARFLSAGFLFAPGSFVEDVPYDPELYFVGEEMAMTVRAYTSGYDLYHPRETIVWHDYVRADATKHWDDHNEKNEAMATWMERDRHSKERVQKLLAGETLASFNLGRLRSLSEYESYAGISFRARRVQDDTMRSSEPPNAPAPEDWAEHIFTWLTRIALQRNDLPHEARDQAEFWYIGVHDELGNEIYRRDLTRAEVQSLAWDQPEVILICELQSGSIPARWTIWPVDRSHRWMRKIEGHFKEGDYSIVLDELEAQHPEGTQASNMATGSIESR